MATDPPPASPLLVRDLMSVGVPTCPADTALRDLIPLMLKMGWEAVVVLNEHGHAVGMVSRRTLAVAYCHEHVGEITLEAVMEPELPVTPPDIPLAAAAQIMLDRGERVLYVTHHAGGIEYPAAWLTLQHLLRHMSGEDLSDLGIEARREKPLDQFIRRRDEARRHANLKKE